MKHNINGVTSSEKGAILTGPQRMADAVVSKAGKATRFLTLAAVMGGATTGCEASGAGASGEVDGGAIVTTVDGIVDAFRRSPEEIEARERRRQERRDADRRADEADREHRQATEFDELQHREDMEGLLIPSQTEAFGFCSDTMARLFTGDRFFGNNDIRDMQQFPEIEEYYNALVEGCTVLASSTNDCPESAPSRDDDADEDGVPSRCNFYNYYERLPQSYKTNSALPDPGQLSGSGTTSGSLPSVSVATTAPEAIRRCNDRLIDPLTHDRFEILDIAESLIPGQHQGYRVDIDNDNSKVLSILGYMGGACRAMYTVAAVDAPVEVHFSGVGQPEEFADDIVDRFNNIGARAIWGNTCNTSSPCNMTPEMRLAKNRISERIVALVNPDPAVAQAICDGTISESNNDEIDSRGEDFCADRILSPLAGTRGLVNARPVTNPAIPADCRNELRAEIANDCGDLMTPVERNLRTSQPGPANGSSSSGSGNSRSTYTIIPR